MQRFWKKASELVPLIAIVAGIVFALVVLLGLWPLVEHWTLLEKVGLSALFGVICALIVTLVRRL